MGFHSLNYYYKETILPFLSKTPKGPTLISVIQGTHTEHMWWYTERVGPKGEVSMPGLEEKEHTSRPCLIYQV